jgi:uncharacterized protein (TIGR00159 family)
MPGGLPQWSWRDGVDVLVVAVLAWSVLQLVRRTQARQALLGLVMLGVLYLVAREVELQLTAAILQGFFAVLVLILVVVFQDDLRRFFEQIATWGRRRRAPDPTGVNDLLVRAVARLAASRTGALFVLPGRDPLERHLSGGLPLGGEVSEPLLLSLFDPSSPGHDGAVVLRGRKVERFAVHLPLSADHAQLGARGTRHAAALGLAERTDALCVVVSEERGTVSVARQGGLRTLWQPQELSGELVRFEAAVAPPGTRRASTLRWREAALALGIAVALWLLFVPGSTVDEASFPAPVVVEKIPDEYELEAVEPAEVEITLSGPRRLLVLAGGRRCQVRVDALLARLGRRTFRLGKEDVDHPEGLEVVRVRPDSVRVSLRRRADAAPPG